MIRMLFAQLLCFALFALPNLHAQTQPAELPQPEPTWITMRDSARVAAYLFAADTSKPKATILIRTPAALQTFADEISQFVESQYSVVLQITDRHPADTTQAVQAGWMHRSDGFDMVEWIAAQTWSTGKVGAFGRGLSGFAQMLTANSAPPHLSAMYLIATPYHFHDEIVFPGGAFRKPLAEKIPFPQSADDSMAVYEKHYPYGFFWEQLSAMQDVDNVNVPIAFVTGWYDAYAKGTIRAFQATKRLAQKAAKASTRLRIGPWTDNQDGFGKRRQGELHFPESAEFDIMADAMRWFDRWLKGDSTVVTEPPVHYFLMGAVDAADAPGNIWQHASDWPPDNRRTDYFLKKDGALGTENDAKGTAEGYRYDPDNPVPSKGGSNVYLQAGPLDQHDVENRTDVLLFTTPPLEEPVAIAGKVSVRLFISSTAYDTDFTAKLTDVYPDGRSLLIADGIVRTRLLESPRFEKLLTPHKVYEIEIDLGHMAYIFYAGHRIRLAVSSSNSPRFEANPNSPHGFHKHKRTIVAVNTIYYGGSKPSSVRLPVISLPQ